MATSLKPRFSKREMMGPMSPRWLTLSVNVVQLQNSFGSVIDLDRMVLCPYLDTIGLDGNETRAFG